MINILEIKKSAFRKVIQNHHDETTVNEYRKELRKLINPDFDAPICVNDVWKVREQLQPENRGYQWHIFLDQESAWRFYESK